MGVVPLLLSCLLRLLAQCCRRRRDRTWLWRVLWLSTGLQYSSRKSSVRKYIFRRRSKTLWVVCRGSCNCGSKWGWHLYEVSIRGIGHDSNVGKACLDDRPTGLVLECGVWNHLNW